MFDAICLVLAAAASFSGFASLALSLPRHWRAVSDAALSTTRVRRLRALGYLLLIAGGAFAVLRDGASFGAMLAVLVLITSAWAVAFTLTWRPHWLRPLALWSPPPHAAARDVSLASLLTAILWLTCVVVGVWGFASPMSRPRLRPPEPPPTVVEPPPQRIEVELAPEPAPAATETAADPARPPPLAPADAPAPPPALIAVATPIAATNFVLPVQLRVPVPDVRPPDPTRQPAPVAAAPAAPPAPVVQKLIFGQGEGKQPAPAYPSQAQREGQEGEVVVRFHVSEDGRVRSAELTKPSPWPLLNRSALQIVRERWSFPAGRARLYEVSIQFELSK